MKFKSFAGAQQHAEVGSVVGAVSQAQLHRLIAMPDDFPEDPERL
jgi:hypothetical protein